MNAVDYEDVPMEVIKKIFQKERKRRQKLHKQGCCPYCRAPYETHTCKFKGREATYFKAIRPVKKKANPRKKDSKTLRMLTQIEEALCGNGAKPQLVDAFAVVRQELEKKEKEG